eukprot:1354199-Amorphochlora_amoeboformis.AAC.1
MNDSIENREKLISKFIRSEKHQEFPMEALHINRPTKLECCEEKTEERVDFMSPDPIMKLNRC